MNPVTAAIAAGAERLEVALGPGVAERLGALVDELLRWNRRINLVAPCTAAEAVERHVLDSLAVLRLLDLPEVRALATDWWDVGAGSGFPGLALALARPELGLTLVEPIGKKVAWLREAGARFGLERLTVRQARAEALGGETRPGALSRATFAPEHWARLAEGLVPPGGPIVVMMGAGAPDEVTTRAWRSDRLALPESGATRINVIVRADAATPA
ncbi:MAG: 16S rRNA (guanine(527)-N(7))-methyltransferase RsmG [Deltaproteobacteria bacterium]|nr:16S rRNA (guanine(527)-N(7))-methyltransferase RsmG [Deltaproteobacteria bacterium]MCB9785498.1 16S rRNA (guanine(527)-N(7))-methyltransferase RsmG [Deltaproteobacteria bacterium]